MTKEMYLLTICDNVRNSCGAMIAIMAISIVLLIIFEGTSDKSHRKTSHWSILGIYLAVLMAIICVLLLAFVPSTDSIIKAYCIKEGSKIVTAENIKDMSKEISSEAKKITDAVVERIKK